MRTNPRTCAGGRDIVVEVPNLNAFGLDVGFHVFVQTMGIRARNGAFPDFESTVTGSLNGYKHRIHVITFNSTEYGCGDQVLQTSYLDYSVPLTAADGKR